MVGACPLVPCAPRNRDLSVNAHGKGRGGGLGTLWRLGRPHTLIGTALSLGSLWLVARYDLALPDWSGVRDGSLVRQLPAPLVAALALNLYITGLNQWADVGVDQVNKPWLPIVSGEISRRGALWVVVAAGALGLGVGGWVSGFLFTLLLGIALLGTAYSLPPLLLKRHHVGAAFAITLVRGVLVNVGFYLHFRAALGGTVHVGPSILPLTAFVTLFSVGIAWFKDIPDTRGDAAFAFGTLAVRQGRRRALKWGAGVVALAYGAVLGGAIGGMIPLTGFIVLSHVALLAGFMRGALRLDVNDDPAVLRFYRGFWGLFFAEYLIYPMGLWLAHGGR